MVDVRKKKKNKMGKVIEIRTYKNRGITTIEGPISIKQGHKIRKFKGMRKSWLTWKLAYVLRYYPNYTHPFLNQLFDKKPRKFIIIEEYVEQEYTRCSSCGVPTRH